MSGNMTPWLEAAQQRLGTKEGRGKANNAAVLAYYADVGHAEVTSDDVAWCAAFAGSCLKSAGFPVPPRNINLMARSYLTYGVACEPKPGAIAIWPRGKSAWEGHVNIVESVTPEGKVVCVGGNQSDAVTRTKPLDPAAALGFRWPIRADLQDLKAAGSTEVATAGTLKTVSGAAAAIATATSAVTTNAPVPMAPMPDADVLSDIGAATEAVTGFHQLGEAVHAVGTLLSQNPWIVPALVIAGCGWRLAQRLERARLDKAAAGLPISREV